MSKQIIKPIKNNKSAMRVLGNECRSLDQMDYARQGKSDNNWILVDR